MTCALWLAPWEQTTLKPKTKRLGQAKLDRRVPQVSLRTDAGAPSLRRSWFLVFQLLRKDGIASSVPDYPNFELLRRRVRTTENERGTSSNPTLSRKAKARKDGAPARCPEGWKRRGTRPIRCAVMTNTPKSCHPEQARRTLSLAKGTEGAVEGPRGCFRSKWRLREFSCMRRVHDPSPCVTATRTSFGREMLFGTVSQENSLNLHGRGHIFGVLRRRPQSRRLPRPCSG